MEPIIYRDTPLAEYLEGNGENSNDWGVDPSTFVEPMDANLSFAPNSFSTHPRLNSKRLKSLRLHGPGWRRRNYLYELFSKFADSHLSRSENARFLERFRYIIVASQLLSEHINVSHYNRRIGDSLQVPTEDDSESAAFFGPRFAKERYMTVNGICIVTGAGFLRWIYMTEGGEYGFISMGRTVIALLGISIIGVFLFSNARRRWLRTLRGRAIELATQFVENNQAYDILVSNAITFIQEVELVSRGYRLSMPLPPISRIERDHRTKRCARLRRSVLDSLNLCIVPYSHAFRQLRELTEEHDLDKYYDIYDIRSDDLEQVESGIKENEFEDMEGLKALKTFLHRLHTARKIFLCCLLALDANGGHSDFATWRTVVAQLKILGSLMGEVGKKLQRHFEEEEKFNIPPSPSIRSPQLSPNKERWSGQLRKLNSLSQALRGLQAKMQILREESDRTLQESVDLVEFGPHLLAHYDSIGSDLQALMNEWETGRAMLLMSIDKQGGDVSNRSSLMFPMSPILSNNDVLAGDTPRNSWGLFPSDGVEAVSKLKDRATSEDDDGKTELVFEAVAEPKGQRPRSTMTREERIRKVQEERLRIMEERKKAEAGVNLVKELQSVLESRPPAQQRKVPVKSAPDSLHT
ncbi:Mysoin-binding motif of peroxisomes-domain-containing protein [Kalaharituber pfeilii]|nr:Mysoin-binding motif of peroxisomes-domain-containing protein [Kalaharituber pfeilii]